MTYQARMTEPDRTPPVTRPTGTPIYDAQRLVGTQGTATIVLDDKTYTLRITRAGKLILTK
ncbi:hemin uptake protein HemP [Rhodobacteraceae bacterium N5(2021)]|uniref:Hemin uptake protein HemP n=1 Tax=Gymnodinialimonas phycosphaerae TaxID=2841589 RepID=A0A975TYR8_9RHOB|nr:hemin uptake protein HemP [Gymnodinialimonas phycosphaerae]MBY4893075.1 hemin uptake protein HemP [Gymnodinialimonas phycosphaerae]